MWCSSKRRGYCCDFFSLIDYSNFIQFIFDKNKHFMGEDEKKICKEINFMIFFLLYSNQTNEKISAL